MKRTFGVVLATWVVVASLFAPYAARAQGVVPNSDDAMAIDVDPATPGVQVSATVPVGSTFSFTVVITAAPDPYTVYQSNVRFNPNVVQYVSGPVENGADGNSPGPDATGLGKAVLCAPGNESADRLFGGCLRTDFRTQTDTGATETWTMKCIGDGATPLHLLSNDDVGVATGTQFALAVSGGPQVVSPVLQDGVVNCGAGTPIPGSTAAAESTRGAEVTAVTTSGAPAEAPTPNATEIEEAKTPGSPAQATVTALVAAATSRAYVISAQETEAAVATSAVDPTEIALAKTPGSPAQKTATARAAAQPVFPALQTATAQAQAATHTGSSGGSSNTGLIIGIVAAVAVIGAGAGGVTLYRRRGRA